MEKHRSKLLISAFILFTLTLGVSAVYTGNSQKPVESYAAEVEPIEVSTDTEVLSPDGKMILYANTKQSETEKSWIFKVEDEVIFNTTSTTDSNITIPFNTFSPDNKYIFLQEETPDTVKYIVLSTSGKPLAGADNRLEISSLFNQKYPDFSIAEVTGWAAPTLIIINTDNEDDSIGPSFWFDVSTRMFYKLSTRFN